MVGLRDVHIELVSAIRKHVTDYHAIDGRYCTSCRNLLFFILHAICARLVHNKGHCCK